MAATRAGANRVVIALMDGTRLKGFVYNFSPNAESLHVFPDETSDSRYARMVETKECKAIFFVRTLEGNREARERARKSPRRPPKDSPVRGVRMRVYFRDGEVLEAASEAYSPMRLGFFAFPLEPDSNNLRIYVINANVRQVVTGPAVEAGEEPVEQERLARVAHDTAPPAPPGSDVLTVEGRMEAVLRILRGKSPEELSGEMGVPEPVLLHWAQLFLLAGRAALAAPGGTGDGKP